MQVSRESGASRVWSGGWAPDGSALAYVSNGTGDDEMYVVASDGADVRNVSSHPADDGDPVWIR